MYITNEIVSRVLGANADIVAVYVLSSEARIPLTAIGANIDLLNLAVIVHERTPYSEEALRNDRVDAVIAQDPGHAVRSAIRIMRARTDAREPLAAQERIRIEILLRENL